jgi:hypothetical protein
VLGPGKRRNGHSLGRMDLYRQFCFLVRLKKDALLTKQEKEGLSEVEQRTLNWASERLACWQQHRKAMERSALKLLGQTGLRERSTNRQTKLTADKEIFPGKGLALL